jgi:hypothetical protein
MDWFILALLTFLTGLVSAYTGRVQAATLWIGKKIAPSGIPGAPSNGFQDAITPKSQTLRNVLVPVLFLGLLVYGFLKAWYVGVSAVATALVVNAVASRALPNTADYWLMYVIRFLDNREADYRRDNDHMRADAAHHISDLVKSMYKEVAGQDLHVPPIRETRKT